MLTLRLWYYIVGFLRIRVRGERLEEFTNLAMMRGIVMWDIRRHQDGLEAKVGLASFASIWPLAQRTDCRLRIRGKRGLPFVWRSLRKRPGVLVALFLVILMLAVLSRFVWFVDVRGAGPVQQAELLVIAQRAGLKAGALKTGVDTRIIEHHLLLEAPDIVWTAVRFEGVRAIIEVAERQQLYEVDPAVPGDIVAEKDGIITQLLVLAGEARVTEGDTVASGQVLIQAPKGDEGPGQARGEVRARTWYQAYGETPLVEHRLYPTGRAYVREVLVWGDYELVWKGREEIPFQEYETYTSRRELSLWRNLFVPVELVTHTYREFAWVEYTFSPEEARAQAAANARSAVKARVPGSAEVGEMMLEVIEGTEAIGVKVTVEVIEEIGRFRPVGVEISVR